jgi:hypothetical protein
MVMPLTLTLISEAFPAERRGMAIAIWGGIAGLAVAAGPVVGGRHARHQRSQPLAKRPPRPERTIEPRAA